MSVERKNQTSNRLIHEKSPYLLQHAYNPVDWYAWNDEAFEKARKENKPIFLSIGYSTCHWCHVMEHESFEDDEVAKLMNATFVNIKVDREERPDIDKTYMQVAQMMTGRGGWPLTIIMTPEKKPFYADTYIPKMMKYNKPGMVDLIPRIDELWKTDQENITDVIKKITDALDSSQTTVRKRQLDLDDIENAFNSIMQRFDQKKGGFGRAPKFPSPHNMLFLLRYWKRTGDKWALHMVEKTLKEMRIGGVYDHIGFGFHRYSTDQNWLVPHFEKMLYDQAMMLMAYTETYLATKDQFYATVVDEIVTYLKRDLMSPDGVFYSAEDADSEGIEGKFYVWTFGEIQDILAEDDFSIFSKAFNIKEDGNFHDEASREKTGNNIPFHSKTIDKLADELGKDKESLTTIINDARHKLLGVRSKRIRPHLDDKILTDWNGLMIAALAKASRAFNNEEYLELAEKAVKFIGDTMRTEDGRVLHRYREGEAVIHGFLDDYAFLSWGLLELYYATYKTEYLIDASEYMQILLDYFWDKENGGFFFTDIEAEDLLTRQIDAYDGAIPSGNSVALYNLIRLGRMLGNPDLEDRASEIGSRFSGIIESSLGGFSMLLCALDFAIGPTQEVVIAGNPEEQDTSDMISVMNELFLPSATVMLRGTDEQKRVLSEVASYTRFHDMVQGKATAHVCVEQNCKLPTTESAMLAKLLNIQQ